MSMTEESYQARSSRLGREFREFCKETLMGIGFRFRSESEPLSCGTKVELIYDNDRGIAFFFEVTGTTEETPTSPVPGLERTDNVKKIICNAFLAQRELGTTTIVLTSHKAPEDSASSRMLAAAGRNVIFDVISVHEDDDLNRLRNYLDMDENELEEQLALDY